MVVLVIYMQKAGKDLTQDSISINVDGEGKTTLYIGLAREARRLIFRVKHTP